MKTNKAIEAMLDQAQSLERCAFPQNHNQARAMVVRYREGYLVRPYYRCYARASYWNALNAREQTQHIIRAVALWSEQTVFTGLSALAMYENIDYPYFIHRPQELFLATTHGSSLCKSECRTVHHIHMQSIPRQTIAGVPVTDLYRTIIDCIPVCSFAQMLPIFDWLQRNNIDLQPLKNIATLNPRMVLQVKQLISYSDGASENGGESYARGVMLEQGFSRPELQHEFANKNDPDWPLRSDYLWVRGDGTIIVAEYDGLAKYGVERTEVKRFVQHERARDEILRSQGVSAIIHFNFEDVIHPERLRALFEKHGVPRVT